MIFVVFLGSRLMWVRDPICYDESGWAQIAREVVYHGKFPYVDFFDNKPPLVYPIYLLAATLIKEPSELAMRSFGLIYQGLCLGLLMWAFNKYVGRGAAVFVGLTEAVVGSSLLMDGQCWLMTEQLMKPLIILWFVCLFKVKDSRQDIWCLVMGIVTAAMMWTKQTYVFFLVPVVFYVWWQTGTIKYPARVIVGWTAVSAIILGFFLMTGTFVDLKTGAWDFNMVYYLNHPSSWGSTLEALAKRSFYLWPNLMILVWIGKKGWGDKKKRILGLMLVSLVSIGLYSAWAGGERMYRHYLVLFVFPLVMYAGVGWAAIKARQTRYWAGMVLVIVLVYSMALNVYQRDKFLVAGYQSFYQELARVRQLVGGVSPGGRVSLWGDAMQFYYPLDVNTNDKYLASEILTYPSFEEELDRYIEELVINPPDLIVTGLDDKLANSPRISEWLKGNFELEKKDFWLEWVRK